MAHASWARVNAWVSNAESELAILTFYAAELSAERTE